MGKVSNIDFFFILIGRCNRLGGFVRDFCC